MKIQTVFLLMCFLVACASQPEATTGPDTPVTSPPGDQILPSQPSINPFFPKPEDQSLRRGNAYLDEASLAIRESFPPQVSLSLKGNLPTPCHQLRVAVSAPDAENKIAADVYSIIDPNQACIEVLAPFEEYIDLGTFPTGHYTVWVNGEMAGEFDT